MNVLALRHARCISVEVFKGYLAHKKTPPPRTLPWAYAQGPRGVLGGWGRGTPVHG
jgi:hypothetical protein